MIAYHNDAALRVSTLARMRAHAAADEIVQGRYWERGKGCLVGCAIHVEPTDGDRHTAFPATYGIPEILARLADCIFEGLSAHEAKALPVAFFEAIPLGADLSLAWPRFAVALLTDPERGVARLTPKGSAQRCAIENVAALFARQIDGGLVTSEEWTEARRVARARARAPATYATATYATATATYATATATATTATATATAAYVNSAIVARADYYSWMSDILLAALRSCKVPS